MQGLADDGGLFMPDSWPKVDLNELKSKDTFLDVAKYIVPMFTKSSFTDEEVLEVLENTWHDFSHNDLAAIKELDDNKFVLEL